MTIIFKPSLNSFLVSSKRDENLNYRVFWNKKISDWCCDCWWYANRTIPNKDKWGYCNHIKEVLKKYGGRLD